MDEEKIVPNYALDIINANHNATLKRLWALVFTLVFLLVGTNVAWVVYESQFEDIVMTENKQDGAGVNIIGGGDVNYGADTNSNENTP